ncbi:major facilitator superfamily domain-containing protein [Mycena epipterygia]|nr:major facilitator superfamily domain-containing protein [Mycena epipterygia]
MGMPEEREESPTPTASTTRPAWRSVLLVLICTLAMITNNASSSAVSIFLPVIGDDLDIPENQLQWLVSAFSLSSVCILAGKMLLNLMKTQQGCFLLLLGRLADLYGRKKLYIGGTLYLGALSLGCGFAQNATALYILRGFQGLGVAAFIPACLGILAHAFPPSRARSAAFATFSAGAPIGGAVGTQIGAVLTQYTKATWRAPFFLIAGVSCLCAVGGLFLIDPDVPSTEPDKRVDWLGAFLVTTGLVLLVFVLGQGSLAPNGWKTGYIIALLIVSVLFLVLFLLWQHYLEKNEGTRRPPLMKLTLWSRAKGKFAVMQFIAFFQWATFLSWYFWAQVYYEDYIKLSPVLTAVRMLPMTVAGGLCNVFVVLVISRMDLVFLIVFGTFFTGLASLLFALILPSAPYWAFGFPATIVSVFGADFVFAAGTLFIAKISLPHEQSLAGGLFQTLTQLGTAFGLAISTIAFDAVADGAGAEAPLKAYKAAQWTAFGMAMLCTLLAATFLRGVGPVGSDERKLLKESGEPEKDVASA